VADPARDSDELRFIVRPFMLNMEERNRLVQLFARRGKILEKS